MKYNALRAQMMQRVCLPSPGCEQMETGVPFCPALSPSAGLGRALVTLLLLLVSPTLLYGHLALATSSPSGGAVLTSVPAELRLAFTEPVEMPLSSVTLIGPGGEVALGVLRAEAGRREVVAPLVGELLPGEYLIRWQAVGLDGHPVRGEVAFTVAEGAEGVGGADPDPEPIIASEPTESAEGDGGGREAVGTGAAPEAARETRSALYSAVRGLGYVGIIGGTGVVAFVLLLFAVARQAGPGMTEEFRDAAGADAMRVGLLVVLLLAAAAILRLQSQAYALFGSGVDSSTFPLLIASAWGRAWIVQAVATGIVLVGFGIGTRRAGPGVAVALPGVVLLSYAPALTGHSAAVEAAPLRAVLADGLHVLAVGGWLGALLVFLVVGVPHLRRLPEPVRATAYTRLLRGFSSMALVCAGVVLATGIFATSLHLHAASELWRSEYGRLLLAKLVLVAAVLGAGAWNWRRLPHDRDNPVTGSRLRRSGTFELVAALLVIAVTSVLVGTHLPGSAEASGVASGAVSDAE